MPAARPSSGNAVTSKWPALLLGIGLGGFLDGIVLHQILQWHHLVSNVDGRDATTLAGLEANTLADGLFHVLTWVVVLLGASLTVRSWRLGQIAPTWRSQIGLLLAGWGLFNVADAVINHHLLGLHHVRDDLGGPLSWDLAFLMFGTALVAVGFLVAPWGGKRETDSAG